MALAGARPGHQEAGALHSLLSCRAPPDLGGALWPVVGRPRCFHLLFRTPRSPECECKPALPCAFVGNCRRLGSQGLCQEAESCAGVL